MNSYDDFVNKLKALQVQGYQKQYIIDIWNSGKNDVLILLYQDLVVAVLRDDKKEISKVKRNISDIKTLNKRIQVGLLEESE